MSCLGDGRRNAERFQRRDAGVNTKTSNRACDKVVFYVAHNTTHNFIWFMYIEMVTVTTKKHIIPIPFK